MEESWVWVMDRLMEGLADLGDCFEELAVTGVGGRGGSEDSPEREEIFRVVLASARF